MSTAGLDALATGRRASSPPVIATGRAPRHETDSRLCGESHPFRHRYSANDTETSYGMSQITALAGVALDPDEFAVVAQRLSPIARRAARRLSLRHEVTGALFDEHGRAIVSSDKPNAPAGPIEEPALHRLLRVAIDRSRDMEAWRPDRRAPRWPTGKRYAVALTHDVDDAERPVSYRPAIRYLQSGDVRRAYWEFRSPRRRPASAGWDFDDFCGLEDRFGFRSAWYFSVVPRRDAHPCDVAYDIRRRRYRSLVARLDRDGWEIGLHSSYATREDRPPLRQQVDRLQQQLARLVFGVRHHYLRWNADDPRRSWRAQFDAGLAYDTSVGYLRRPGWRAGIAAPYHLLPGAAPDIVEAPRRELLELPMTLADMHLPTDDDAAAIAIALEHLRRTREIGGLAVLNWHVGHWHGTPAWRRAYEAVCETLAADREAWVALPRTICHWWRVGRWQSRRPSRDDR